MLINTGQRTDIPAFFTPWFMNRIQEGYVMVRNPYVPAQVHRYELNPHKVDLLIFCSKNPAPMLPYVPELLKDGYRLYWHVTITPYGRDIEPYVPPKESVMDSFRKLSRLIGRDHIVWRYDPILLTDTYTVEYHLHAFEEMAEELEGATENVVISFLDLYEKTKRNFPEGKKVCTADMIRIGSSFAEIAAEHGMTVRSCCEGDFLAEYGIRTEGCMTKEVLERALGEELCVPSGKNHARKQCRCLLGGDIGAYNSCMHGCRYCYANYDREAVLANVRRHDPHSPLLIGHLHPEDEVRQAEQESWLSGQYILKI